MFELKSQKSGVNKKANHSCACVVQHKVMILREVCISLQQRALIILYLTLHCLQLEILHTGKLQF